MQGERRETQGKQFKTFRKRQILVWLGIEPTPQSYQEEVRQACTVPGGKAITERGSSCCSGRTFQSPKKRADAQGKRDLSLMSLSLSHSPPKPRLSPQISPSCPLTISQYKSGSATFHLKSFHISPSEPWLILSFHSCFTSPGQQHQLCKLSGNVEQRWV